MWTEPILHVDMDSFFVEVERLSNPGLRSVPVAVGGRGPRGVVASASYEARRHGVHSAQPTAIALKVCPGLKVVPPSHGKYREMSVHVFSIFREFTPLVEGLSLDEAYLDVSGLRHHHPSAVHVADAIRFEMRKSLGLPCSVGVASNKLVAKLASESAKPDGVLHVPVVGQVRFLHDLPASALPGVGPATLAALQRLGVATVADLAAVPEATLSRSVGPAMGRQLIDLASGLDRRRLEPDQGARSVSVEETYAVDLEDRDTQLAAIAEHAHRLSSRLRRAGLSARTISIKVRYPDFETLTRSQTRGEATHSWREIFAMARAMLDEIAPERSVRLLGVAATALERHDSPRQMELQDDGWERVEDAVFAVRERFGDRVITPGRRLVDGG